MNDQGYWNFVAASIYMLFIIYIASKSELKDYVRVLAWNPQPPIQVASIAAADKNSALGGNADASKPVNIGGLNAITGGLMGSPGTQIVPPGHTVFGDLMKKFGF
jgi:hypothetical protein